MVHRSVGQLGRKADGNDPSTTHFGWVELVSVMKHDPLLFPDLGSTLFCDDLSFVFVAHVLYSNFSSLSKFCYSHIRELRCIRPYLDSKTASTIAASIVHSKLVYCNSLYYNLPKSQINQIRFVPIFEGVHWR